MPPATFQLIFCFSIILQAFLPFTPFLLVQFKSFVCIVWLPCVWASNSTFSLLSLPSPIAHYLYPIPPTDSESRQAAHLNYHTCRMQVLSASQNPVQATGIMSGPTASPTENSPQRPSTSRRSGRGRGNRGPPRRNQAQSASNAHPSQQETQPEQLLGPSASNNTNGAPHQPRGPKRGRRGEHRSDGGRARQQQRNHEREIPGRAFQGRLTRPGQPSEGISLSKEHAEDLTLRADAPEFVPGVQPARDQYAETRSSTAPSDSKTKSKAKTSQSRPKVTTKSTAPDISTRIHEDIMNNLYECPICTGELGRKSRVWSCELCWTVFHLSCVKKWSKNEGSAAQDAGRRQQQGVDSVTNSPRAWRCPGCNLPQGVFPSTYTCWCEKEVDPRSLPGLPPHSCGQTCSRPRKGCPHPCDSICHSGPCTPCTAMGPTQDCFCGRNSSTKRCRDTDYLHGWSCGETCGDLLPCGEHTCPRPCHEGLCGACEVKVEARCYCGKVEAEMLCSSRDEELESQLLRDDQVDGPASDEWTGSFNCGEMCGRPLDCSVHFCQKKCHPQDAHQAHCSKSPDVVLNCPCGKTPLADIPGYSPRTSCEDPIPNCQEPCGKILPCGHPCEKLCHTGSCGSCMRRVSIDCRCGRNSFMTICHQGIMEPPQCFRVCKATLHCGRHTCTERCCPGEQKAVERQAMRRKLKPHLRPVEEDVEAEHICTRVCGRTLKCERHTCPEICHKGTCNTCREAIFEEISCNCGRSVLHPPLPCGTQPPSCSFPCERQKPCGHPQTDHNCHTDDETCPKCPFLIEKMCLCGKKLLKNQPCWLVDARCGQICGEPLKCGSHFCQKNCHRPGECEDASHPCQQACGKTKTLCGHSCTEPCHAPYPCPETTPCSSKITVTCGCGRLRQERRCGAVKEIISKGQVQQHQRLPGTTPLTCDDECGRLERNRSLASALGVDINPATTMSQSLSSTSLPYSSETLDMYIQLSSSSPLSTLQTYEAALHSLATSTTQRSIRFQPAKPSLRAFSHSLATDWGFVTESFDPEPHRHVFVLKPTTWKPPLFGMGTPPAVGIGGMSVGECVKTRERHLMKERETQRIAAAEAKALREAAKAQASGAGDGWAQVASRRGNGASSVTSSTPLQSPNLLSGSMYAALATDEGPKKERLVLRSGVGAGKQLRSQTRPAKVADSWEEEEEKEEQEEREREHSQESKPEEKQPEHEDSSSGKADANESVTTAI